MKLERGTSNRRTGDLAGYGFLVREDGSQVDEGELVAITELARMEWTLWDTAGLAPEKWGNRNAVVWTHMVNTMYAQFPYLRLAQNHWKCSQLGHLGYPSWYGKRQKMKVSHTIC
jgi:hypothetical protein